MRSRLGIALLALFLFAAEAWRSAGYYNPDEYFQTVEFASYKLGVTAAAELPWEFPARMRPFLQPALYAGLSRVLSSLGCSEPSDFLLAVRMLGATLALAALCLLARALGARLPDERTRRLLLAACLFTWYVPFLAVRMSAENWSGSLFAIGFASFFLLPSRPFLAALSAGLAMGLAFDFRYQIALAVAGFFAWAALVRRTRLGPLGAFAAAFLAAAVLGVVADRWGYGAWTPTPWNYLRVNLVEGRSLQWGHQPATFYLTSLLGAHPPLSSLLLAALVVFWVAAPRDPITWAMVPFVLGHAVLAHKELRFLFPLSPLAAAIPPLLLLDPGMARLERAREWLSRHRGLLSAVGALNLAFLLALLLVPVRHDLRVQTSLREKLTAAPGTEVVLLRTEPFVDNAVSLAFLRPPGFRPARASSWDEVEKIVRSTSAPVLVVARLAELPPAPFRERFSPKLLAAPLPEALAQLLAVPVGRTEMRALWAIDRGEGPGARGASPPAGG